MEHREEDKVLLHEALCTKSSISRELIERADSRFKENINLVYYVMKKFKEPKDNALDREDLIQEGFLGLWEACLNFDESKGFKFTTYAIPSIRGRILHSMRSNNSMHFSRTTLNIRNSIYSRGFTIPLSDEEIKIIMSEEKFSLKQIMNYSEPIMVSIDSTINNNKGDEMALSEVIPGDSDIDDMNKLSEEEIEFNIGNILNYVSDTHKDMIEEYMYAAMDGEKISQEVLSVKYGVSQAQVCRVLQKYIREMRYYSDKILFLFGI